ncbi:hypothetical protein GCM10009544_25190 [Streptomyces stramineus]|uniref:Uncharacterized protein n=1 Tax=Streptomyces stramineus TaxID=173861 RepID=A0ABP3JQY9_9ACTN
MFRNTGNEALVAGQQHLEGVLGSEGVSHARKDTMRPDARATPLLQPVPAGHTPCPNAPPRNGRTAGPAG